MAIEISHFSCAYGERLALENITLTIPAHQVTAIIGPSGCGKSTLLKCLNRLAELEGAKPVAGAVQILGQDIYDRSVNLMTLRRQVGMVLQKPVPFPMSIFANVAYGIRYLGDRRWVGAQVEQALQQAGLWAEVKDRLNDSALKLSGGQQQRLCIARTLAVQPQILLMDEPCSALDPISTATIEELIGKLRHQLTIVIVTHNLAQARRIADRTAFLHGDERGVGRLIEYGETRHLFQSPQNALTRAYVQGDIG
jgi:phosphate transport system ATP-binding protein